MGIERTGSILMIGYNAAHPSGFAFSASEGYAGARV